MRSVPDTKLWPATPPWAEWKARTSHKTHFLQSEKDARKEVTIQMPNTGDKMVKDWMCFLADAMAETAIYASQIPHMVLLAAASTHKAG